MSVAKAIEEPVGMKVIDANNWYNPETEMWTHVAPDGASTTVFHVDKSDVMSKFPDLLPDSKVKMLDANNWCNTETGEITHVLPDGASTITFTEKLDLSPIDVDVPPVDIPPVDDGGIVDLIHELIDGIGG